MELSETRNERKMDFSNGNPNPHRKIKVNTAEVSTICPKPRYKRGLLNAKNFGSENSNPMVNIKRMAAPSVIISIWDDESTHPKPPGPTSAPAVKKATTGGSFQM